MSRTVHYSQRFVSVVLLLGLAAGVVNGGIRRGLVGYYPLDEGAGNTAYDVSGEGHDGTLHNGVTWISPGYIGGAVNFDGTTNTRIELGTWDPTEGTGQLSLAAWIRWDGGMNTYQGLVGKRNTWPDTTMFQWQVRPENGGTFRLETGAHQVVSPNNTLRPLVDAWVHVAATFDGTTARLYLNGEQVASGPFALNMAGAGSVMGIGCVTGGGAGFSGNAEVFQGDMDEVYIYSRELVAEEISQVMVGIALDQASNPRPEHGAADVPLDVILIWDPMETAVARDVYFGTAHRDVNDAGRADPRDVLVSQGQTATSFDPGLLDYGTTYYWRIDEVNAPPDSTVFAGNLWSFETEPYAYPLAGVTATASSFDATSPPARTVDGSGLDPLLGEHSNDGRDMWVTARNEPLPAWIQFELPGVHRLHQMKVWNFNASFEPMVGYSAKDVVIEYSLDGEQWLTLKEVEILQAPGSETYAGEKPINLEGIEARFVRLVIESNWSPIGLQSAGLSEVQFLYAPMQAREPQPADGATDVALDTNLIWRPGREVELHEVYFGADADAVAADTVPASSQTQRTYTPPALDLGTTYFWRVDQAGELGIYEGELWSFATQEFLAIEDFEGYDDTDNPIWGTWLDGYEDDNNGSLVGHDYPGPYAERSIVRSGRQSMPLYYDNTGPATISEAIRTFSPAQDWTVHGADTLVLHVRGNAPGFMETAEGEIMMNAIGVDIWDTRDEFRYAYKNLSGDGSIVVRVDSLIRTDAWAKAGVMIRESLHPGSKHAFVCVTPTPDHGVSFQQRPESGNVMSQVSVDGRITPHWVKLTRTGNVFTAQESADGITWEDITFTAPVNISMPQDVLVGLALTSHNPSTVTAAEFSNLEITGTVTGPWQIAEIGAEQPKGNSAEPMYIRIEDGTGAGAMIMNPDEAITLRPTWQRWAIPYDNLGGVDFSRVRTMYIGVGNPTAPIAGGTGTVYIDDIALARSPVQ